MCVEELNEEAMTNPDAVLPVVAGEEGLGGGQGLGEGEGGVERASKLDAPLHVTVKVAELVQDVHLDVKRDYTVGAFMAHLLRNLAQCMLFQLEAARAN